MTGPVAAPAPAPVTGFRSPLCQDAPMAKVLLVEDDDGDAFLVGELLRDVGEPFELVRATSVAQAMELAPDTECVLLDLGLPDAEGLGALAALRAAAPEPALVVLTGLGDRARGIESLQQGAQDYLVKGEVDGPTLARACRYAIERRRAEVDARRLAVSVAQQSENDRLARGLLPHLDLPGPVDVVTRYRPGADALLGGDFFDAVVTPEGRIRAMIGDVCGHGPAEAAVGVALRIAWRTMTLAGADPASTTAAMHAVLLAERDASEPFATVLDVTIDPSEGTVEVRRHGHIPPLLVAPEVRWLGHERGAPPIGFAEAHIPSGVLEAELPEGWGLLLVTDGIYEGKVPGGGRLGHDAFVDLVRAQIVDAPPAVVLDRIIGAAQDLHGGDLDDDLALLWISAR